MMDDHVSWTQELDDALRRLIETEGMSGRQACETMKFQFGKKFTRNSIIGRSHRLRLQFKRSPGSERKPEKPKIFKPKKIIRRTAVIIPLPKYNIPMNDLNANTCRWPAGDAPPYSYCGKQRARGAFCSEHAAMAYVQAKYSR